MSHLLVLNQTPMFALLLNDTISSSISSSTP